MVRDVTAVAAVVATIGRVVVSPPGGAAVGAIGAKLTAAPDCIRDLANRRPSELFDTILGHPENRLARGAFGRTIGLTEQ